MNRCMGFAMQSILILTLLAASRSALAQWQLNGSANALFSSFNTSDQLNTQYDLSVFLNGVHLDTRGLGIGFIHQSQSLSIRQNISTNLFYLGGWQSFFPDTLSGRLTLYLDYYTGSDSLGGGGSSGAPGGTMSGNAKAGFNVIDSEFTDDIQVINPRLLYTPFSANYGVKLGYAHSEYDSSDSSLGRLKVDQWVPGLFLLFNDQYDRIILRHYAIELDNDLRTPGVDSTRASELSWSHWYPAGRPGPSRVNVSLLFGERLYAVDDQARRVYNLADMQTAGYSLGAHWNSTEAATFYIYGGLEQYEDVSTNDEYNSLFIYAGVSKQW